VDEAWFTPTEHAESILSGSHRPNTGSWPDVEPLFTHEVAGGGRDEEIE
jgi:hypothetical protein